MDSYFEHAVNTMTSDDSMRRPTRSSVAALVGVIALMLSALGASSASANQWMGEGADRWINTGGYFVVGGLTGWDAFDQNRGQDFDATLGFEIRGGARLNKYLAIEAAGDFLSGFDTTVELSAPPNPSPPLPNPPEVDLTVDGGNVTVNVLAYFPFGRIQPYALVGLGGMWARLRTTHAVGTYCYPGWYTWYCTGSYASLDNDGAYVMKFGGGTDFYLTEDWAFTIDVTYVMPFGDLENLEYVNLGWGVRFNF